MDFQVASITKCIQENCNISDARHAGVFSLCGLLLRLRDLFKWEKGLDPWEEPEPADLMSWVDLREELWETLTESDLQSIELDGAVFDPFDVSSINRLLTPRGAIYGAGYAVGMKPSFFLGELEETRCVGELQVNIVGGEMARDIFISPLMRQGNHVLARRSAMLFVLWDQLAEMRPSAKEALCYAMAQYGLDAQAMRRAPKILGPELKPVALTELETWIHHEIGEFLEEGFLGDVWHEIVSAYSNSPIEIYARVVKDLLADTHPQGLLGHIVKHRIKSSLGFYVAGARPFTRLLFPEIRDAFERFMPVEDWSIIEEARIMGQGNGKRWAKILVDIHRLGKEHGAAWARERIMEELIHPLGIGGPGRGEEEGYRH